jgi:hypothetical protein
MGKKQRRRPQAVKSENKDWMRARVDQTNMNLTVPSGNVYKRKPKHAKRGWDQ